MPEVGVTVSKQPFESIDAKSAANLAIFVNIAVVVEVDEIVAKGLTKNQPNHSSQADAHGN
jgi:hypothetical protein